MAEKNYDFRKRHWTVHRPNLRQADRVKQDNELLIDNTWKLGGCGGEVTENALKDFQDYLWVSMGLSIGRTTEDAPRTIWFEIDDTIDRGFVLEACEYGLLVKLSADKEAFRAVVYLEDIMNLEGAPVVPMGRIVRKPLFEYKQFHSGTGIDEFPDEELLAAVHAGYDTIAIMVKGIDVTTTGHCNINDVIQRAKRFGIGTFIFNYIQTQVHPDDPGAQEVFDNTYGELFRHYPDAIGIGMCGESLEFPSKDPHTTGKSHAGSIVDSIPDVRPSVGWYPCYDYPAYLEGIRKAIHKVKPDANVTFSTYNWGYLPYEERRKFLEKLPKGYSLSVCYEIFSKRTLEGLRTPVMDYTLSADEPGEYFRTECTACKELGIPVQGNVNTTGIAWDFGCIPYVPAPYKLLRRMRNLHDNKENWNMKGFYATHHYGYWNCFAADLGKWTSWDGFEPDYDELLYKIARRDYGKDGADYAMEAWKLWSEAMNYYIASNEDQYGPWRVGAAYPFIFQPNITRTMDSKEIKFPTAPHAHFGYKIVKTLYQPYENIDQAPGFLRYPAEIRSLKKMEALWEQGLAAAQKIPATENSERLVALGLFILCQVRTVIHIKQWWMLNVKLQTSQTQAEALSILDEIEELANIEMDNVKAAIPAVETDSRLGWEPSMEYVCDKWHLDWKQRHMEHTLREIGVYRSIVENAYAE